MLAGWYEKGGLAEKVIEVGDMEIPRAGPGEVLIRLRASSISPSDYKKRAANAPLEFPRIVPHSDGAGVVEALGAGVSDFKVGDRVWTFNAQFARHGRGGAIYRPARVACGRCPPTPALSKAPALALAMTGYRAVCRQAGQAKPSMCQARPAGRHLRSAIAKWGGAQSSLR